MKNEYIYSFYFHQLIPNIVSHILNKPYENQIIFFTALLYCVIRSKSVLSKHAIYV